MRASGNSRLARKDRVRRVKSLLGIERAVLCCGVKSAMNEVEQPTALSFVANPSRSFPSVEMVRFDGK